MGPSSKGENMDGRKAAILAGIDFISGCAGGTASVLSTQPLDTVKVKMQTFPEMYNRGMVDCFKRTYKTAGIKGLFAGTTPNLAAQIAENSTLFMCYGLCLQGVNKIFFSNQVKDNLPRNKSKELLANGLAGSGAAVFVSLVVTPTELIKCQLQALLEAKKLGKKTSVNSTALGLTLQTFKQEGLVGLYRGLGATMAREVPGYGIFFISYEASKILLTSPNDDPNKQIWWKTLIAGGIAGLSFWTALFPTDVVKSRIQTGNSLSTSFLKTFIHISKTEGISALYCGLLPCLLRTFPATACLFFAYEKTNSLLSSILL